MVRYEDFTYTIEGLQPSTDRFELEVTDQDGKKTESFDHAVTPWTENDNVKDVSFKVVDQYGNPVPNVEVTLDGEDSVTDDIF